MSSQTQYKFRTVVSEVLYFTVNLNLNHYIGYLERGSVLRSILNIHHIYAKHKPLRYKNI